MIKAALESNFYSLNFNSAHFQKASIFSLLKEKYSDKANIIAAMNYSIVSYAN